MVVDPNIGFMIQDNARLIDEVDHYLKTLFPITRSIMGNGNRETLKILEELIPINILEYPSGQKVYDWTIPKEWNIKDAWIKNSKGQKIVDFSKSNIHVVGYSQPIHGKIKYEELIGHIYFLKEMPDAIPYRTSYYNDYWGFCVSYNDCLKCFKAGEEYEVFIDSELKDGSLTVGELLIKGKSPKEYLISTYVCHPSLGNDNLSGVVLTAMLSRELLKKTDLEYSYRVIFVPESIGAIAYCFHHEKEMKRIDGGLVITCVAGPGEFGYKESFLGNGQIDRMIRQTFAERNLDFKRYPFVPIGSDERQYSSIGFRIPCASIFKDKYAEYAEYHTSLDNLDFISAENLAKTLSLYLSVVEKMEKDVAYVSNNPFCEPQLGKRGLYNQIGGGYGQKTGSLSDGMKKSDDRLAIFWILFYSDGKHSLLDIAEKSGCPFLQLYEIANRLCASGLLRKSDGPQA